MSALRHVTPKDRRRKALKVTPFPQDSGRVTRGSGQLPLIAVTGNRRSTSNLSISDENPFFTIGFAGAAAVLGLREMPGPDAAFSLAGAGRAGALLSGAGFGGVEFAKADEPMLIGRDVDDVLEYERTFPSASEVLTGLRPAQAGELTRQVRDRLVAYASPGGVTMPGAAWLVTAQAG
jgi:hypothetical protein